MNFYKFISSFSQVETIISLLAFIVACVFVFLAYSNKTKMKQIRKIIEKANTQTQADLAVSLAGFFPSDRIPKLTKQQGFEVIKIQLEHRSNQFKSKINLFKVGIFLLFLIILTILFTNIWGSSNGHNDNTEIRKSASKKPPLTFIFCDFSPSVTENSRDKVMADALSIYDALFGYSYLYFYLVENTPYVNPFLKLNLLKKKMEIF